MPRLRRLAVPVGEGAGAVSVRLSIERIAREAGVSKTTVYRRWTGKDALMLDVLRSLDEKSPDPPGTSVRDDLIACLGFLRRGGLAKRSSAVLRAVITHIQHQPQLWQQYQEAVIKSRRESVNDVLRRGVESGEVRADRDIEFLADLFSSPVLARGVFQGWKELPAGLPEQVVDSILEGVRPRG